MNTETNETTIAHSAIMQAFAPVARLEMLRRKEYLSTEEVAELYGVSKVTLDKWRSRSFGPAYTQFVERGDVFYKPKDVEAFFDQHKVKTRG